MNILVVGGGGREHAICHALSKNAGHKIFCAPGNFGITGSAERADIDSADFVGLIGFARQQGIGLAVIGPDGLLAAGLADAFGEAGIACFGPTANAARIESSKAFSKDFMRRHGIPTAEYQVFADTDAALKYVKSAELPVVVKASGLALGKGVIIAHTREEAEAAVMSMRDFGESGRTIVIESCLTGREVSVLAFCDGKTIKPMISAQDHKRAFDGDKGPNTGGMGAFAPSPFYTPEIKADVEKRIVRPTLEALNKEGIKFVGVLYFGLMLTAEGPKVLEYNARFGDPEAQAVLPLLKGDLAEIMLACVEGRLSDIEIEFEDGACAVVILASGGYPKNYESGYPIYGIDEANALPNITVYSAGVSESGGLPVTSGGRVLGVCAKAKDVRSAAAAALKASDLITFKDMHRRTDIGVL